MFTGQRHVAHSRHLLLVWPCSAQSVRTRDSLETFWSHRSSCVKNQQEENLTEKASAGAGFEPHTIASGRSLANLTSNYNNKNYLNCLKILCRVMLYLTCPLRRNLASVSKIHMCLKMKADTRWLWCRIFQCAEDRSWSLHDYVTLW